MGTSITKQQSESPEAETYQPHTSKEIIAYSPKEPSKQSKVDFRFDGVEFTGDILELSPRSGRYSSCSLTKTLEDPDPDTPFMKDNRNNSQCLFRQEQYEESRIVGGVINNTIQESMLKDIYDPTQKSGKSGKSVKSRTKLTLRNQQMQHESDELEINDVVSDNEDDYIKFDFKNSKVANYDRTKNSLPTVNFHNQYLPAKIQIKPQRKKTSHSYLSVNQK